LTEPQGLSWIGKTHASVWASNPAIASSKIESEDDDRFRTSAVVTNFFLVLAAALMVWLS
jgi:hypothetical protein